MDSRQATNRQATPLPEPLKLSFETDRTRRAILASYWVVVFLALPLWWWTTSIDRLSLPSSLVLAQAKNELQFPVHLTFDLPVHDDARQMFLKRLHQASSKLTDLNLRTSFHGTGSHDEVETSSRSAYIINFIGESSLVGNKQLNLPQESYSSARTIDTIMALLSPYSELPELQAKEHHIVQYAPRYRLAFTLLNEDSTSGEAISRWDVRSAISRHVTPILDSLSSLHNFTVESQVQFHAPLAFTPRTLGHNAGYGISPDDLTVFVNSAEWTLSSSLSNDPVLHFVLFIPYRRPLHILDARGDPTSSNAFILPQWGGIFISNSPSQGSNPNELSSAQLDVAFSAFSHQLLTLLGVPILPAEVSRNDSTSVLTGWQLDALLRRRASENARGSQETLSSIVNLVQQIENLPVGQSVKGDIIGALDALRKVYTSTSSPGLALQCSSQALSLASRAFFNPGMLAMLYFPAEHKYAVYTPLFASAMVPLIAAVGREFFAWRRKRRIPVPTNRSDDSLKVE